MYVGRIVETADVNAIFKQPKHPYTFGMLASVPGLASRGTRLYSMPGQPPDLTDLPPRCNKAVSQCRTDAAPAVEAVEGGASVACYTRWSCRSSTERR
jgi:oligopeptide/dipeptide ABC transporter ATP-binding protein